MKKKRDTTDKERKFLKGKLAEYREQTAYVKSLEGTPGAYEQWFADAAPGMKYKWEMLSESERLPFEKWMAGEFDIMQQNEEIVFFHREEQNSRAGSMALFNGLTAVRNEKASKYLGVTVRRVQQLIKDGKLDTQSSGHNKQVTVTSLTRYLPPRSK